MIAQGLAYFTNAMANSHLRFMFIEPGLEDDSMRGLETFETVVTWVAVSTPAPGTAPDVATRVG